MRIMSLLATKADFKKIMFAPLLKHNETPVAYAINVTTSMDKHTETRKFSGHYSN